MGKVLILRTCDKNGKSHGGFQWPESGPVECPDWDTKPECGNGLHGLLWGEGDGSLLDWSADARWLVAEVEEGEIVFLGSKVKFPRAVVVFCGSRLGATAYLAANGGAGKLIAGCAATAGDYGTATAGDYGTATAGDYGTATAGIRGTATAGDYGTATAGHGGTATAGHGGTATAGDRGTATAGDRGTATAGDRGTATAGDRGTATAGREGTATVGDRGILNISFWDSVKSRRRIATAYVGEGGILPNVAYQLDENGNFVMKGGKR